MTQPGIEPRSPGPLASTLLIRPIKKSWTHFNLQGLSLKEESKYKNLSEYDSEMIKLKVIAKDIKNTIFQPEYN